MWKGEQGEANIGLNILEKLDFFIKKDRGL